MLAGISQAKNDEDDGFAERNESGRIVLKDKIGEGPPERKCEGALMMKVVCLRDSAQEQVFHFYVGFVCLLLLNVLASGWFLFSEPFTN